MAGLPLLAWAAWRMYAHQSFETWHHVVLPEQALWTGIQSYQRHPKLPVLTFGSRGIGQGASQSGIRPDTASILTSRSLCTDTVVNLLVQATGKT